MEEKENRNFSCLDVISRRLSVKKLGTNFVTCCPFHHEDTPSLTINTQKNFWSCFGCKKGGTAVNFVQYLDNISYGEAYKKLCVEYGYMDAKVLKNSPYYKYYKLNSLICKFFTASLKQTVSGKNCLDYLKQRGIDESIVDEFEIGYAPKQETKDCLVGALTEYGYSFDGMNQVGILNSKKTTLFKNRVVFPIKNEHGEIQGFVGRAIGDDNVRYLNTSDTVIFKKGKSIFNLDKACNEMRSEKKVLIVEGVFDVIAAYQAGFKNVVCTLGVSLTKEHLDIIKNYTKNVIVCYDGDSAGVNATIKAYKLCKSNGVKFKCCFLPNRQDPDEFVKSGKDFCEYVNTNTVSIFDYIMSIYQHFKKTPENSILSQTKLFEILIDEPAITQKCYLEKWASIIGINTKMIKKDFLSYTSSMNRKYEKRNELFSLIIKSFLSSKRILLKNLSDINSNFLTKQEKKLLNAIYKHFKKQTVFDYTNFNTETNGIYRTRIEPIINLQDTQEYDIVDLIMEFTNTCLKIRNSSQK